MVELSGKSNERAAALVNLETAMRVPVGAFSPLWMMFAGAASAGVAYWWMARWAKPVNLEALLAVRAPAPELTPTPEPAAVVAAEAISDPDIDTETLEAQAFAQQALDAEAEAAPEPQSAPAASEEVSVAEPVVAEPDVLEAAPTAEAPRPPRKSSAKARPKSPKAL